MVRVGGHDTHLYSLREPLQGVVCEFRFDSCPLNLSPEPYPEPVRFPRTCGAVAHDGNDHALAFVHAPASTTNRLNCATEMTVVRSSFRASVKSLSPVTR